MISLNNFQRILFKFGLWLATGILICLVGITGVFADTYYTNYFSDIYYYDNNGSSISAVNTQWNESMQAYVSGNITTVANSYGAGVGFNSPIQLIKGHTYTFSISFIEIDNIALSSKKNIALGSGPYNSGYNYTQNNFKAETIMSSVTKGNIIQYSFTALENANYIFMPWTTTTTVTQSYVFTQIIIDDLGSSGVTQQDINNSLNNQTNILNNSINNSTNTITQNDNSNRDSIINNQNQNKQDIIDNQNANNEVLIDNNNQNTQDIIDNQNKNNQAIIDDNKKNFQTCRESKNLFDEELLLNASNWILNNNGYYTGPASYLRTYFNQHTDLITFKENTVYTISLISYYSSGRNIRLRIVYTDGTYSETPYFSINSTLINLTSITGKTISYITMNYSSDGIIFIKDLMLNEGNTVLAYEPYGEEICINKLDEQNKQLNDLNSNLTDSSSIDMGSLGDTAGWLPAGPIDSIINLPLNFYNSLFNALNNTCTPLSVPVPYIDKRIEIPCISTIFSKITGVPSLWNWVGTIASVVILYRYLLALYKYYDDLTTLKANFISDFGGAP